VPRLQCTLARGAIEREGPAVLTGAASDGDGTVRFRIPSSLDGEVEAHLRVLEPPGQTVGGGAVVGVADGDVVVELSAPAPPRLPSFWWAVSPCLWWERRQRLREVARRLGADVPDRWRPAWLPPVRIGPPVPFSEGQAAHLTTVAAAMALASFGGSLFTQDLDYIGDAFHASDRRLGIALAVARVGVVVAVIAGIAADRVGRRRIFLACTVGVCVVSGLSALAPSLALFTVPQVLSRGLFNACLSLSTILVIEAAPERARAWAGGMLGLAASSGFALGVLLLPISDLGRQAWRIHYVLVFAGLALIPGIARQLRESPRFERTIATAPPPAARTASVRRVVARRYGRRFALLAVLTYALQVFTAPASQFGNRYLRNERGFSGFDITVFRTVTAGLTGLIGVLIGSRLAETKGRRTMALIASVIAIVTTMVFYTTGGISLWLANTIGTVAGGMAVPAVASFGTELFPTDARGTATGLLTVVGVLGSATGLVLAGVLRDPLDSLGRAIAVLGFVPIVAVVLLLRKLPEASGHALDEVSPPQEE
jgi:putative MFS transporter